MFVTRKLNNYRNIECANLKHIEMHSILQNPWRPIPINIVDTATVFKMMESKDLNPNYQLIQKLRTITRSDPQYDIIKQKMQCWTPNAYFAEYVSMQYVTASSGYVYIDFDSKEGFDIDREKEYLRSNPHVYALWNSVGGTGIGCMIKADWTDSSDVTFKRAYEVSVQVLKDHGSSTSFIDPKCKNISRSNFISYSEVWLNPNAISITQPELNSKVSEIKYTYSVKKRENNAIATDHSIATKLHYTTQISDWEPGEKYRFIPEGKDFVSLFIGKTKLSTGERTGSLFIICCKLAAMNPDVTEQTLYHHLYSINKRICVTPLTPQDIFKIIRSVLDYQSKGELYAPSRPKYVWFNPAYSISAKQKQSIASKFTRSKDKDNTLSLLEHAISVLRASGVKITQKSVAKHSGKHVRTVKRYWQKLKELIF